MSFDARNFGLDWGKFQELSESDQEPIKCPRCGKPMSLKQQLLRTTGGVIYHKECWEGNGPAPDKK